MLQVSVFETGSADDLTDQSNFIVWFIYLYACEPAEETVDSSIGQPGDGTLAGEVAEPGPLRHLPEGVTLLSLRYRPGHGNGLRR